MTKKRRLLLIVGMLGFLAIFMGIGLMGHNSQWTYWQSLDQWLIDHLYDLGPNSLDLAVKNVTHLGNTTEFSLIAVLIACWIGRQEKDWRLALAFLVFLAGALLLINHPIKAYFHRPRPAHLHLVQAHGYSFPSGHSAAWMVLSLSWIYLRHYLKRPKNHWLAPLLLGIAGLVGLSRIYLGVHYPTDVLAGLAIGAACFCGAVYLLESWRS